MTVEMARHVKTRIRYDGLALVGHEMDVQDLAPALLAIAEIVQIANRKFNGDAAAIRVMVDADVEQQCFQIDLSLVQSLMEQAAVLLGQREVATAKEIAEWVGLIGGGTFGLFKLIKWLGQRDSDGGITFSVGTAPNTTIINVVGDGNSIQVPTPTARLLADRDVQKQVKQVIRPLKKEGYDDLTFVHDDKPVVQIDKEEAATFDAWPPIDPESAPVESESAIRGHVRIKSPQYEGNARWSLMWQGRAIDAEMTDQAATWVEDFQSNRVDAPPNTLLDVSMTETVKLDAQGNAVGKPQYVVSRVHSAKPPPAQGFLFD